MKLAFEYFTINRVLITVISGVTGVNSYFRGNKPSKMVTFGVFMQEYEEKIIAEAKCVRGCHDDLSGYLSGAVF